MKACGCCPSTWRVERLRSTLEPSPSAPGLTTSGGPAGRRNGGRGAAHHRAGGRLGRAHEGRRRDRRHRRSHGSTPGRTRRAGRVGGRSAGIDGLRDDVVGPYAEYELWLEGRGWRTHWFIYGPHYEPVAAFDLDGYVYVHGRPAVELPVSYPGVPAAETARRLFALET